MDPIFTSAWIPTPTLKRLTELVQQREHLPGAIIEFGSWEGRSTIAIASGTTQPVFAVDHWKGNTGDEHTEPVAQANDIYARFRYNTQWHKNIQPVVTDIDAFMVAWGEPIKFIHIDADHNYGPVKRQIQWAQQYMVPGGVMCGDDYSPNWPGVVNAVDECLPQRRIEIVMWVQEF